MSQDLDSVYANGTKCSFLIFQNLSVLLIWLLFQIAACYWGLFFSFPLSGRHHGQDLESALTNNNITAAATAAKAEFVAAAS